MTTPLPVIDNAFRLAHEYHTADTTMANIFWLLADGLADPGDVGSEFISAYAHVGSSFSMKSLHSSDVTFDKVVVTPLDGVSPTREVAYSAGVHGTGTSPAAAANAALVITTLSDQRGRAHRGRWFLGGMPAASLETGGARWGTSLITDALDALGGFVTGLAAGVNSLQLLVVSQHAAAGPSHRLVGDFTPRHRVGTQRGRTERAAA